MKNFTLSIAIFILLIAGCRKENDIEEPQPQGSCDFINFKYYQGEPLYLGELSNDYILLGIDTTHSDAEIQHFISTVHQLDQDYEYTIYSSVTYKFKEIPVKLTSLKSCEEITQIRSDLEQNAIVSYVHYTRQTDNCQNAIWEQMGELCVDSYTSSFYVRVIDVNDLTDLNQTILETNTELVKQNQFMANWYELRAIKTSNGDAMEMANYFYETGLFGASEPGLTKYPVK